MRHHDIKGFSLLEVMASLALLSVVLGLSLTSVKPGQKGSPTAMAQVIAERLRAAQARARSEGYPVAIAFPSDGGTLATSQGFYQLEGFVFPRITESRRFEKENPGIYFGLVHWPERGEATVTSAATGDGFVLDAWAPPTQDPMLIFLPNGKVTSNGVAHSSGIYSIVVGRGFQASLSRPDGDPGTANPGPSFTLGEIAQPTTVSVNQEGDILLESRLPSRTENIVESEIASRSVAPPPPFAEPSVPPELLGHLAFPQPVEDVPGADAVVAKGGRLVLEAKAWSPEGVPLFAEWSGPGIFSSSGSVPMSWDPVEGSWMAQVEWGPSIGASVGDEVDLTVRVRDLFGNLNATVGADPIDVKIVPRTGLISYRTNTALRQVFEDGTSDVELESGALRYPNWSPDQSTLVAVSGNQVVLVVPSVGIVKTLASDAGAVNWPKWSPDGTKILYSGGGTLWVMDADGSNKTNVSNLPANLRLSGGYGWHPKGTRILFGTLDTSGVWTGKTWTVKPDGSDKLNVLSSCLSLYAAYSPVLSSGEVQVAFYGYGGAHHGLHVVDEDFTTTPKKLTYNFWTGVNNLYQVGWSSDGKYVSCYGGPNGGTWGVMIVDVAAASFIMLPESYPTQTWGVWSPYSSRLLYQGASSRLSIVDFDGTGVKKVTTGAGYDPDWIR